MERFLVAINMPEIPDLEAFSRNLTRRLSPATLDKIVVHPRAQLKPSATAIRKAITGKKLRKVQREGKQLFFHFSDKATIAIHLMLHGEFRWAVSPKPAYVLVEFHFTGKPVLWLTDFHRQANLTLDPGIPDIPDVLDKKLDLGFWKKFLDDKAMVKSHLRNQDLLRGMGNAYTDEILYEAKISPFSVSSAIPITKIRALTRAIKKVYADGAKQIERNDPEVIGGEYRAFMKIHNSKKELSPSGYPIKKKTAGGSKTYFTDEQVLYK
ncbi:MAG: hypothetical protein EOO09_21080 [Chitinophagaceae bacterium]|nr:MAG: hypothetical protein EOO09_21080 [Chitinophagaceae bacterium]